jgi:hypothetical protein
MQMNFIFSNNVRIIWDRHKLFKGEVYIQHLATICFWEEGLKYVNPELVDSFVENKNSVIKVICSDLHICCHNVSVKDKG